MKHCFFLLRTVALAAACWIVLAGVVRGQALTILHRFGDGSVANDGTLPSFPLVLGADGNFYGGTATGGTADHGTIFKMTPSGVVTILHNFGDGTVPNDGTSPQGLILAFDGNFYGTTVAGGSAGQGTVFKMTPGGTVTVLHSFQGAMADDGADPNAGLVQASDGNFYGTTTNGGTMFTEMQFFPSGQGVIFKITPQGVETILHVFGDGSVSNDGANPYAVLMQASDGNLYGTTFNGGVGGGVIFETSLSGTYRILHTFADGSVAVDGDGSESALTQGADGNLYGAARTGTGPNPSNGILFKITLQGAITVLYGFSDNSVSFVGQFPQSNLLLAKDGNFYGTTPITAPSPNNIPTENGTVYRMTPQGVVTILHNFGDGSIANDGGYSASGLIEGTDGNLYGVTEYGGNSGQENGTAFKLTIGPPALSSPTTSIGTVATPLRYQITGTNSPSSFAISAGSPALPAGLSLDSSTGLITGTPTAGAAGTTVVSLTLTNASATNTALLTFIIAPLPVPVLNSPSNLYGVVHAAFTHDVSSTTSTSTITYAAMGLPPGLSIAPTTGVISGTPTTAGTSTVTLTATNSTGQGTQTVTFTIFNSQPALGQEYSILSQGSNTLGFLFASALVQGLDGTFYGVAPQAGVGGYGTVFNVNAQGTSTPLHSFGDNGMTPSNVVDDGAGPQGITLASDGNFYGTTQTGGTGGAGTIFKIKPDATEVIIYNFPSHSVATTPAEPTYGLVQGADGNFYGTTALGGPNGNSGTAFQVTPQGKFTLLHVFGDGTVAHDGTAPNSGLIQGTDGFFYGTTTMGGTFFGGTVFKMSAQGAVTILHNFNDSSIPTDGRMPMASLIQASDGNFYGTTFMGGANGAGCVFKMTPQGVTSTVYSFIMGTVLNDGTGPQSPVIQGFDGNLYGTTLVGGSAQDGIIYEIILSGPSAGTEIILHNFGDGTVANDGARPIGALVQGRDGNFYGTTSTGGGAGNGVIFTIQGNLAPTIPPTIVGATTIFAPFRNPLLYAVQALQSQSASTTVTGSLVKALKPPSSPSLSAQVLSFLLPAEITPTDTPAAPTRWILSGDQAPILPPNLAFDSSSGTTTGLLITTPGMYTFSITPQNDFGAGTQRTVTMFVETTPTIGSTATDTTTVNQPYTYQVTVSDEDFPFSYSATHLPSWLSIDTLAGNLTGTPPGPGTYIFSPLATNLAGSAGLQVTLSVGPVAAGDPLITSPAAATAYAGTDFYYRIAANNSPTSFGAVTLPPGLLFNSATGEIYGLPTTQGTTLVPISATTSSGATYSSVLTLTTGPGPTQAPVLPSTLTVSAVESTPISYQVPATGILGSYHASIVGNQTGLPTGLSLNSWTGVISGTPTVTGTFEATLTASNGAGNSSTATLTLNIVAPINYNQWATNHQVSGGATASPKMDGVPNLLKYLYDINPAVSISATSRAALPTLGTTTLDDTDYLTLTYRQYIAESGLTLNIQTSPDLQNWTTVSNPTIAPIGTDPNTGDPIMQALVPATGTKQFLRLDVVLP